MAMLCDACGAKFDRDGGQAILRVTPVPPDFKLIGTPGYVYEHRTPVELDLCLGCTAKILAHLGLPTDACAPPPLPPEPLNPPNAGALSEDDLRVLGDRKRALSCARVSS